MTRKAITIGASAAASRAAPLTPPGRWDAGWDVMSQPIGAPLAP